MRLQSRCLGSPIGSTLVRIRDMDSAAVLGNDGLMRVKMCSIHVVDPVAAFGFYTGTLGFAELMAIPEANLFIVQAPDITDGPGLLLEPSDNPIAENYRAALHEQGIPAIVFGVPDVKAEYERLSGLGVRFVDGLTEDQSGLHATLDDGCGNYVRIHQD